MRDTGAPADGVIDEYVRARPIPALRPLIAWYGGYRQAGLSPGTHRGLPSPYLTLIITIDQPLRIDGQVDRSKPAAAYDTLVGGLHTVPALIAHNGSQSGIQLSVHPLAARLLLGLPAGELAGDDFDAADVLGAAAGELHERVREAVSWPDRFAVLDDVLSRRADFDRAPDPEVAEAWRRLQVSGGSLGVSDLAADLGWSTRYLARRFGIEVGLSPKQAARVMRFDHARRTLQNRVGTGQPTVLAHLAVDCGYYDQAHLAREFRELAGCPPSRWVAEEFRFIQGAAAVIAE
jgi:AraC-like DNA-binding protein